MTFFNQPLDLSRDNTPKTIRDYHDNATDVIVPLSCGSESATLITALNNIPLSESQLTTVVTDEDNISELIKDAIITYGESLIPYPVLVEPPALLGFLDDHLIPLRTLFDFAREGTDQHMVLQSASFIRSYAKHGIYFYSWVDPVTETRVTFNLIEKDEKLVYEQGFVIYSANIPDNVFEKLKEKLVVSGVVFK